MGKDTEIAWCDHTFNPWWGCFKISPGCDNCYAATFDKRVHGIGKGHWGPQSDHRRFGDERWNEPRKWNAAALKAGVRRRVFCASMADVFEGRDEDGADRVRLWALIEATPALDWLLLTKRPENMLALAPVRWIERWPANVWAGCTVEDQPRADQRIHELRRVPASVRFLSVEPMLSPITFRPRLETLPEFLHAIDTGDASRPTVLNGIHWVIVGGESGHGARRMQPSWARAIRDQCRAAGVAFFFKQWGDEVHVSQMTDECAAVVDAQHNLAGNPQEWWRVGKKLAGHQLDGETLQAWPEAHA